MRLTGDRACSFNDVYFLELKDLDPNSSNRLGIESYPKDPKYYPTPHSVVKNIVE